MTRYMLDTNMVSFLIRKNPLLTRRLISIPMSQLCISAVTKGELIYGITKHSRVKLEIVVTEFLKCVDVLPWDSKVADYYGKLRANMLNQGKVLAPLDMMIAAHALAEDVILVTNDHAFQQACELTIEDWTK